MGEGCTVGEDVAASPVEMGVTTGTGVALANREISLSAAVAMGSGVDSTFRPDQVKVRVSLVIRRLGSSKRGVCRLMAVTESTRRQSPPLPKPRAFISSAMASASRPVKASDMLPCLGIFVRRTTLSGFSRS